MLIYTGAMTRSMREPALRAYHAAPDPKIVMSYGACGCTGGIFHDNYCVWGGTDPILPVDVYVPGCPPSPPATIFRVRHGFGPFGPEVAREPPCGPGRRAGARGLPAIPQGAHGVRARGAPHERVLLRKADRGRVHAGVVQGHGGCPGAADALIAAETDTRKRAVFMDLKALLLSKVVDE